MTMTAGPSVPVTRTGLVLPSKLMSRLVKSVISDVSSMVYSVERLRPLGEAAAIAGSACSTPPAIGRNALIGNPHSLRQFSGLPEHVDRNAAAWVPIAADAQPFGFDLRGDTLADGDRAVLVKGAVVTEARNIKLEGFGLEQPLAGYIVDHQVRKIGLTGDRAKRGKFRGGKPHDVIGAALRIGNAVEFGGVRCCRPLHRASELQTGRECSGFLRQSRLSGHRPSLHCA